MGSRRRFVLGLVFLLGSRAVFADTTFTVDTLIGAIHEKDSKIRSVEDLIGALPDSMRTGYVLMTKSNSRHRGTTEFPRVISYERNSGLSENLFENAPLLLAYSGDPKDPLYRVVEAIQYRPASKSWEFREFRFPADPKSKAPVEVSDANPQTCVRCHDKDGHPNWEDYPHWPGAVGEHDTLTPAEKTYLTEFIQRGDKNPRYKALHRAENLAANQDGPNHFVLPFTGLLDEIRYTNTYRIADRIRHTPDFDRYKYAIDAAMNDCKDIWTYIPPGDRVPGKEKWEELNLQTRDVLSKDKSEQVSLAMYYSDKGPVAIAVNFRYLFDTRGIKWDSWTHSPTVPYLLASTDTGIYEFVYNVERNDPGLSRIYDSIDKYKKHDEFCATLKERSLIALQPRHLADEPPPYGAAGLAWREYLQTHEHPY